MNTLIVVNQPSDWQFTIPDVEVVPARSYLTDPAYSKLRGVKLFNLCRNYRYQSTGYYVSLLAAARGHKPLPTVSTIQDMKLQTIIRVASDELEEMIVRSLGSEPTGQDKLSFNIYFGRSPDPRCGRLGSYLFKMFEAPLLRADFSYNKTWQLQNVSPIPTSEIPADHNEFMQLSARDYLSGKRLGVRKKTVTRYDMAILYGSPDSDGASDDKAIQRFVKAAEVQGFETELIHKEDYGRLAEFDALFIRETTSVNHYTYRFARKAKAEGLIVMDDPESILKCTNKVYLAELLERQRIDTPRTIIVHRDNINEVPEKLGFPCILKQPDSSFSQGVSKVENEKDYLVTLNALLDKSDLVIAQEFLPTDFDWRIGILDQKPLFACQYFMAKKHWQILKTDEQGIVRGGKVTAMPVEMAPRKVVRTALTAANLIGNGFYGVDIKTVGKKTLVIEVNDNPSVEFGDEDGVIKEELYTRVMAVFLRRVESVKNKSG